VLFAAYLHPPMCFWAMDTDEEIKLWRKINLVLFDFGRRVFSSGIGGGGRGDGRV